MKKLLPSGLVLICSALLMAQTSPFDPAAYRQFLAETQSLSATQLLGRYPAGRFESGAPADWGRALYSDSIDLKYELTDGEKALLLQNGFMVSERLSFETFAAALGDIYHKDLPLYISADAILHAAHVSYDDILKRTEVLFILPRLQTLLEKLHAALPGLAANYQSRPEMAPMIRDVDLYIAMARRLLNDSGKPLYKENQTAFAELLTLINGMQPASYPLFSLTPRNLDFSQFQVRGHYTDVNHPELGRYFRAMMWLGRTELYLIAPKDLVIFPSFADVQRQIIDALLVRGLVTLSKTDTDYNEIDKALAFFVGECDNVTLANLDELSGHLGITEASQLLDSLKTVSFQETLATRPFAYQRINSQMLWSHPLAPDSARPAAAFLLLGQRFIVDSYVTGQVVFDKIKYNNIRVPRMLPSTLDVLFALGNDAAGQLLQPELEQYHYAPNLAAVRYLIDGYDDTFWRESLFNNWLSAIRGLNPPAERSGLPPAMRTAAWWQRTMNSQLSSWAELRHDNLLYAKQSYSSMVVCSFPHLYLEPAPQLFMGLKNMAAAGIVQFSQWNFDAQITAYFQESKITYDRLYRIAAKTLTGEALDADEAEFLQQTLRVEEGCSPRGYDGWYPRLYAMVWDEGSGVSDGWLKRDYLIADVHTSPTDEAGAMVGWVKHVGTGPINLGVMVLPLDGKSIAFVSPMMSYYEHLTTNFRRLTDEEWALIYNVAPSLRPDFVNAWLADAKGNRRPGGVMLLTGVEQRAETSGQPYSPLLSQNYPNPFNASTLIHISIPAGIREHAARLAVFDRRGRQVRLLFAGPVAPGHYLARWDGCGENGRPEPSGIYFYRFTLGEQIVEGRMSLVR